MKWSALQPPEKTPYRICTNCIMDTTDPDIEFDEGGACSHCREYERLKGKYLFEPEEAKRRLDELVNKIKEQGEGKEYDCIIGLSGGVDSSYVAYKVKELGLRPLAVHLDNGWDSEPAVANIERIIRTLDIDLYTHVIDWEEFRELQLAFIKASVIDIELLTDHAIFAVIYEVARRNHIKHFLSGYNVATESVMPRSWFFGNKLDSLNIKSIWRRYGNGKRIKTFPMLDFLDILLFMFANKVETVPLLNYIHYDKAAAMALLRKELGWVYYGGKHYESRFTQFYQSYILPHKFNVDKRRAHLSSLIYSGQLTRDKALEIIKEEMYTPEKMKEDREFVIKKLGFTEAEFDEYIRTPARSHYAFLSYDRIYRRLTKVLRLS